MEPWLRGTTPHSDPVIRALLHSFEQVREDLQKWTSGLSDEQIWMNPHGLNSVGHQMKHLAGSVDRLTTYAQGNQLSDEQLQILQKEKDPDASLQDLLALVDANLKRTESWAQGVTHFDEPRFVGRKLLPTTVGGLIVHIAEHTQRHLGQAILTCKLLK